MVVDMRSPAVPVTGIVVVSVTPFIASPKVSPNRLFISLGAATV
jgi:hypothetical protein